MTDGDTGSGSAPQQSARIGNSIYTKEDLLQLGPKGLSGLPPEILKQLANQGLLQEHPNDRGVTDINGRPVGSTYNLDLGDGTNISISDTGGGKYLASEPYKPTGERNLYLFMALAGAGMAAGAAGYGGAANGYGGAATSTAGAAPTYGSVAAGGGGSAIAPGVTATAATQAPAATGPGAPGTPGTAPPGAGPGAATAAGGARAASEIQPGNGAPGPNSGIPNGDFTAPGDVTTPSGTNPFTMETVDDWWDWDDIGGSLGKLGSTVAGGLGSIGGSGLLDLLTGLYQSNRNRQTQEEQMRLFAPYNQAGRDYLGRLNESYDNPESYLGGAEYQAIQNTVHNQLQRKDAAGGKLANAFPRQAALQELAMTNLGQYRQGLSGTMNNLAAIGTGQGQINALNQRNSVDAPLISSLTNLTDPNRR